MLTEKELEFTPTHIFNGEGNVLFIIGNNKIMQLYGNSSSYESKVDAFAVDFKCL